MLGARIACETARRNPNRVVVLILVDAVTGAAWDRRIRNVRRLPLLFAPLATEFLQDFAGLLARIRETDRSADLIRLGFDTYIGHVQHPMRSFAPVTLSLIKAPPSVPLLEEIARAGVPTVVIWGDQDRLVSRACAESTAEITNARLIVVKDSGHSWPLQNRHTAKHILVESLADERAPDSLGILLSKVVAQHARVNPPKPDQPVGGVPGFGRRRLFSFQPPSTSIGRGEVQQQASHSQPLGRAAVNAMTSSRRGVMLCRAVSGRIEWRQPGGRLSVDRRPRPDRGPADRGAGHDRRRDRLVL